VGREEDERVGGCERMGWETGKEEKVVSERKRKG
jgi:hypothetical protein